jgi:hypothetical protein
MIRVKLAILGLGLLSVLGLVGCRGSEAGGTPPPVVEPDEPVSLKVERSRVRHANSSQGVRRKQCYL